MRTISTRRSCTLTLIGLGVLLVGGCRSTQAKADSKPAAAAGKRCGADGFTKSPSEHMLVELEKPFKVRSVEGVISSEGGEWPEGTSVIFELRSTRDQGKVRQVRTDSRGSFKIPDLPPGEYCFKATANGWQSVMGVIVVARDADAASKITFEMPLGV